MRSFKTIEQFEDRVGHKPGLPSEWAMLGFYVVEGPAEWAPKIGVWGDYYSHLGEKRTGKIVSIDHAIIVIRDDEDGELKSFWLRHGRNL